MAPGPQRCPHSLILATQTQRVECVRGHVCVLGVGMQMHAHTVHTHAHTQGMWTTSVSRHVLSCYMSC